MCMPLPGARHVGYNVLSKHQVQIVLIVTYSMAAWPRHAASLFQALSGREEQSGAQGAHEAFGLELDMEPSKRFLIRAKAGDVVPVSPQPHYSPAAAPVFLCLRTLSSLLNCVHSRPEVPAELTAPGAALN